MLDDRLQKTLGLGNSFGDATELLFDWIPSFATVSAVWATVIQPLVGPVVVHKLSRGKASVTFAVLLGIGTIEIALNSSD